MGKGFCQLVRVGLSRPPADLSFEIEGGFLCRVLERPGRWMGTAERRSLLEELRSVFEGTRSGERLSYGVFSDHPGALDDRVITLICDRGSGRTAGFTALCLLDLNDGSQAVHLGLAMVHPDFRGRGLTHRLYTYPWLLMVCRARGRPTWVSNVTQVPAIFGMVGEACEDVFPAPGASGEPSEAHRRVAEIIMRDHRAAFGVGSDAGFDRERFIIINAYTGGSDGLKKTYAAAPKHRDDRYNEMCLRQLDYRRGDDFLQIGRVCGKSLLRCLARRLTLRVRSLPLLRPGARRTRGGRTWGAP